MPGSHRGDFTPKMKNPKRSSASCPRGKGWHPRQGAHQPGFGLVAAWPPPHPDAQKCHKKKENQGTQKSIRRERGKAEKPGRAAGPGGALKSPLPSRTVGSPGATGAPHGKVGRAPQGPARPPAWCGAGTGCTPRSPPSVLTPPPCLQPRCLGRSSSSRTAPSCAGPASTPAGSTPCTSPTSASPER